MDKIRAFIAIELPVEVKRVLTGLQDRLKSGCRTPVRWTAPDATHLTLKFLGDVDAGNIGRITEAMTAAAGGAGPLQLAVGGTGVFPDAGHVRVVWVGLEGDLDKLSRLQKNLEAALEPLGFAPEGRPFTPHLTLGRVRDYAGPEERQALGRLVSGTAARPDCRFEVSSIYLIKSQLTPQGPIYTHIGSVELK